MADFRGGKPWVLGTLTAGSTKAAGLSTVAWTTWAHDGDVDLDTPTAGKVTVNVAGLWVVIFNLGRDAIAVSSEATCKIRLNDVDRAGSRSPASTTAVNLTCSLMRQLAAGDVVHAVAQLSSGATAGFNEETSALSLTRVGPVRYTS